MDELLTPTFLQLFCEKNSDGTRNLRLKGRDLWQRKGKRIGDTDMKNVSEFANKNPDIVKVDLCYNDIGDRGLDSLVRLYLKQENNLVYLNLVGCNLGYKGMYLLYTALATLKLTTLRINGNKIGFQGGTFLGMILEENNTIKHLDIGDCDQTINSVPFLMSPIRHDTGKNRTLKVLDISRIIPCSKYYQYEPGRLASQIGDMLKVNPTLMEMHAQKCEFDGHDIQLLLYGTSYNKTLLLLDLGYNRMGDHGIELLALWLHTRPALLGLNVAGNNIKDTGARVLSFHMPFSRLRLLDISQNKIKDEGMIDILNTIKKPYVLRLLYIWGNTMTDKTLKIIDRMFISGVLEQENIDVKLYTVDGVLRYAYYASDHYKHKYYCVMDYGCPVELRIKRNNVEHKYAQPRHLVKFQFYPRVPAADDNLPPLEPPC